MGKSSGGGQSQQPVQSTVTQSNLPEYARPYFEDLMSRGQTESQRPYEPYGGARLQTFAPREQAAFGMVEDLAQQGTPQALQLAGQTAGNVAGYQPGFTPSQFQGGIFDNQAASQYMSPYLDQVLNRQQDRTMQRFNEAQGGRDARAVQAGAFGGSRAGIVDEVARREMQMQLGDNEARAMDAAYTQAQQGFQSDAARSLQAQQYGEQSQQYGAGLQQGAQGLNLQAAGQLQGIAGAGDQIALQRAQALGIAGGQERGLAQQGLDIGYQDFVNQRDFPRQNLQFQSSLLRGVPVSAQSEVTQYQAPPNPGTQLAGLGITALGAYNAFGRPTS